MIFGAFLSFVNHVNQEIKEKVKSNHRAPMDCFQSLFCRLTRFGWHGDSLRLYTCLTFPCRAYFIYGGNCLWQKTKTRAITKTAAPCLPKKTAPSILSWGKSVSRYRSISHRMGSRLTAYWKMWSSTLPPLPEKIRNNDCQSAHAYDILVPASIV